MNNVIYVRASRQQVLSALHGLSSVASGHSPQFQTEATGFALRLGTTAMSFLREAYIVKARGGTDAAGLKWEPLAPSTIEKRLRKGTTKGLRNRLDKARKRLAEFRSKYKPGMTPVAKGRHVRAKQKFNELAQKYAAAGENLEILRDSGRLYLSLSPGLDQSLQPDGILRTHPGEVICGTNVSYAKYHHSDAPRKMNRMGKPKLPRRPLWPDPSAWPSSWWRQIQNAGLTGMMELAKTVLSRAA